MIKLDAIAILGGGLIKDKLGWRTTNYNEGDSFGIIGDRLRVLAGYCLYTTGVGKLFIASGGKGLYKEKGVPIIADIIKKELIELGIPSNLIITETNSINSYQQLKGILSITKKASRVGIISNDWHLPRIKAMLKHGPELKNKATIIKLLPAEEILLSNKPKKWGKIIKKARQSKQMEQRLRLEQKGIAEIKNGNYKFI